MAERQTVNPLEILVNPIAAATKYYFLGRSNPPVVAPGAAKIAEYQAAGFTPKEIAQFKAARTQEYLHSGFSVPEIEAYWGDTPPHSAEVAGHVANNLKQSGVTVAQGPKAAFEAGWGISNIGIIQNMAAGKDPNKAFQISPDDSLISGLAHAGGQMAGDLASMFGGAAIGATLGAAVPVAGETGTSEVIGGLAGGFGAGAAPQAIREVLLNAYNRNEIHNVSDFLHVIGASAINTLKAGIASAPFGLAGPIAGKAAEAGAGKVTSAAAGIGGSTALGVSTGAALDGRVPDGKDFLTAGVMILVTHTGIKAGTVIKGVFKPSDAALNVQHNLEEIYRRNGTLPWDAIEQAKRDPAIRQELLQQDVNGDSVAPRMHANAPQEPPPYKSTDNALEGEPRPMKNITPKASQHLVPKPAPIVKTFEELSTALEGSKDASVSPAGAIGKHQIMPGTARQYGFGEGMSQSELVQWLHKRENNEQVFIKITADLRARFHGDMNAMLIAYNAGPGRAAKYMSVGPGTQLRAIPDRNARGGIRYESEPSMRDESWLPYETQKYLANGRRRSGGATEDTSQMAGGRKELFPSADRHAVIEEAAAGSGGGGKPPGGEPPLLGGPDDGSGSRKRYTFDEATDEIMANVGEPSKPPSLLNPDTLMTQYLSELTPAHNIDSVLVKEGRLDRNIDIGREDMFRQTYASDTRAGAFVRFGILEIGDGEIRVRPDSPSMMKAVNEIHEDGGNMRAWTAYMLSKRTVDKAGQGIKTGFNLDAAKDMAADPEAWRYKRGTETFNKVMTGGLEYARDSGYLSQAQVDAMVRDNPAYLSMRRIMGDDVSFGSGGRKSFVPREALRKMEGSDRSIVDPIAATIDNLRVLITMADRNRAIGSIIGQVESGKLKDLGLLKLEDLPKFTVSAKAGDPFVPYGLGREGEPNPAETYAPLLAERKHKGLAPNEFIYYRNGIAERWSTKSPELADLIRKSTSPGEVHIIGKIFDTVASLERTGIALSPNFPTRVSLLNEVSAFVLDPHHPPPFITMLRGVYDAFTEKGVFKEWVANGGAGSALADMDVKWLKRDMEATFNDQGVYARMWNRMQHPIEAAQWVTERMDAASRIGYYKMAVAKGLPPMKAATRSRTAYLDFAEKAGLEAVNSLARKIPFMRSALLGYNQIIKAFTSRPIETFAYLGVTTNVLAAALYAANYLYDQSLPEGHEKEKYDAIPRWVRDTHYITPPIAGARIKIPYIPVIGTFLGGFTTRFLDYWVKSDPHAFDNWARSFLGGYGLDGLLPAALKTPLEVTANYNFFTGQPIVPASVEAADGYMQYINATTEPAKAVSRALGPPGLNLANFSPIQLEYFVKGITGTVGMDILKGVNGRMTDYQPPWQMADIPGVGTFFVRHPETNAQQIQDFYTDLEAMKAAHADWSLALKHRDEGEIAIAAQGPFYGLRIVGQMADSLHVLSAAVVAVNKDTSIPPAEKSQTTDQLVNAMIQLSIIGSGITAQLQGKEPSQAFKDMDKQKAWEESLAVSATMPEAVP